jgi:16S rRNA (guanine1207-N2)-methyltransferase
LNVLDIGCGSGAVALGIAARDPSLFVYAIDSNARAVECTERNAAANNLTNISVALDCDGSSVDEGDFDLAVANPPYYSNFRIAELFVQIAAKALCRGGQLLVVTKTPEWYAENLPALGFSYSDVAEAKNYTIVQAERD